MEISKIVVASDSFKGSLSSKQVADCFEKGVHSVFPHCQVVKMSVADGGEGTMEAIVDTLHGQIIELDVSDPLMRPIRAKYGIIGDKNSKEPMMAVMEMSAASGLPLLLSSERNPWLTSTYGTGEMIMDALGRGCRKFLVGIGGSATNDAGIGMLSAMGYRFLSKDGRVLKPCGGTLGEIASIDDTDVSSEVREAEFFVACDVDTPFCGPSGAAYVFSPQKGADEVMVDKLDKGMYSFAKVINQQFNIDFVDIPGTGAAGGLGAAFHVFLNSSLKRGVDMVLDAINFDDCLDGADFVVTGEGRLDFQTAKGKTPYGVLLRASRKNIPTIAIGGSVEVVDNLDFTSVFPIVSGPISLQEAMLPEIAARNVEATAVRIMNLVKKL